MGYHPGGYQVGGFRPLAVQMWNDKFRDTVRVLEGRRRCVLNSPRVCRLCRCLRPLGQAPWSSATLSMPMTVLHADDLVSHNEKHNEANGENNQDGHSDNLSWNHGAEGPTDDGDIAALHQADTIKLRSLLLAQGTPMLLAGDEIGRTQQGNNNAYAQAKRISWSIGTFPTDGAALD